MSEIFGQEVKVKTISKTSRTDNKDRHLREVHFILWHSVVAIMAGEMTYSLMIITNGVLLVCCLEKCVVFVANKR